MEHESSGARNSGKQRASGQSVNQLLSRSVISKLVHKLLCSIVIMPNILTTRPLQILSSYYGITFLRKIFPLNFFLRNILRTVVRKSLLEDNSIPIGTLSSLWLLNSNPQWIALVLLLLAAVQQLQIGSQEPNSMHFGSRETKRDADIMDELRKALTQAPT